MNNHPAPTKRNQAVFVELPNQFYGARVVYIGKKHVRVRCYYGPDLKPHNVPSSAVWLQ